MRKHPISPIPPHGGVYAVTNETTGHVYIGRSNNLARRFNEWRHAMVYKRALKNGPIADLLAQDDNLYHWTFTILYDDPDATQAALARYEDKAIERFRAKVGNKLLNSFAASEPVDVRYPYNPTQGGLVTILDENGNQISQTQAAKALGCRTDTLKKRLALYRKKRGIEKITLEELSKR